MILIKIIFVIKIKLYLDIDNFAAKKFNYLKTFQHYHVFVTDLNFTIVESQYIYVILSFEVKVNTIKNLINLNKKYENNLQ